MQSRGNLIFNSNDKWYKVYLAYNANKDYTLPLLQQTDKEFINTISKNQEGIVSLDKYTNRVIANEYHDHRNLDGLKHKTQEFETLEEALKSCTLPHVYTHKDGTWEYLTIKEANPEYSPAKVPRKNVWREWKNKMKSETNKNSEP